MQLLAEYAVRRTRDAVLARLTPLETTEDHSESFECREIGNEWTRRFYGGPFHLLESCDATLPAMSLVFVQSREGNTGADDPDSLGGGAVDKHVIYEGLSRVGADAVLAGAKTAAGEDTFFSIWHPEIVSLRSSLGLPRHPAQILVSRDGRVNIARTLLFNVPDVQVFVLTSAAGLELLQPLVASRPWVSLVRVDNDDLRPALAELRMKCGIRRISAIGGRTVATSLVDGGLVQDLCLTTTSRSAGEPNTPFYIGQKPPVLRPIVRKRGTNPPITFEHFIVNSAIVNC